MQFKFAKINVVNPKDKMNNKDLEKKIKQIIYSVAYEKWFVCAVDLLIKLEYLSKDDYDSWRFGKISYLEKVCQVNLNKLHIINNEIRKFANELKLEPSWTAYDKYGKGAKSRLRFSISGAKNTEDVYATHYVNKIRTAEIKMTKASLKKMKGRIM